MVELRELEHKDISVINGWRNDPELISYLGAPFRYINQEVDEKWYKNYMENRKEAVRCAIIDTDTKSDIIIGLISLTDISYLNQSAQLHIMIGESRYRGKGFGKFALNKMLYHGFYNMNLQRIELMVLEDNVRAQALYEKMGFRQEGRKRRSCYKKGKFVDVLIYSILKEEYKTEILMI